MITYFRVRYIHFERTKKKFNNIWFSYALKKRIFMKLDDHITKRHHKTLLLYHIVCALKYRKDVITDSVGESLKEICLQVSERYELHFIEIGYESEHVHFLVQRVPTMNVSEIARTIKSISSKELFQKHPEIEMIL